MAFPYKVEWHPAGRFDSGRAGRDFVAIVYHRMVGTLPGTDAFFKDPNRPVSTHFGVGRDPSPDGPVRISQYVHLCAAGYDYTKREMPLVMDPIVIGDDVWLAADVFVGSGVTIGNDTVVGARSTVFHSLPPRSICAGDNATRRAERVVVIDSLPKGGVLQE